MKRDKSPDAARFALTCLITFFILAMLSCAGVAVGCGWTGTEHSVRFNAWLSEREFGRLPALPFRARGTSTSTAYESADEASYREYELREEEKSEIQAHWNLGSDALAQGDVRAARKFLRAYVDGTTTRRCVEFQNQDECREHRNSAIDSLDVMAELDRGAPEGSIKAYLEARRLYDGWKEKNKEASNAAGDKSGSATNSDAATSADAVTSTAIREALDRVPRSRDLDDNIAYMRAATLFREGDFEGSIQGFQRLAENYPKSEKREAALFMVGRLNLKLSVGGFNGLSAADEPARPEGRDEYWKGAEASFRRLLRDYPPGRLAADARGLLAYAHMRVGDTAEGLAEYYRMLALAEDAAAEEEALASLGMVGDEADRDDVAKLETLIEDEPRVALTYAYHRIYNYALRGLPYISIPEESNPYRYCYSGEKRSCFSDFYKWEEDERTRLQGEAEKKELTQLAAFATRMYRRYPNAGVGAAFALRLAQTNLE